MKFIFLAALFAVSGHAFAQGLGVDESVTFAAPTAEDAIPDFMEEFDPADPNAEAILQQYDRYYEQETGMSSHLEGSESLFHAVGGCYQIGCALWADVDKSTQRLHLYEGGKLVGTWKTSTGRAGHTTPNFDTNPDGRIYQRYSSKKFPGGDYKGLGNMPYAVFISGGFAIHGTPAGNWSKLGQPASHGCIRIHPENGEIFNRMVRHYGVANVWITVHN